MQLKTFLSFLLVALLTWSSCKSPEPTGRSAAPSRAHASARNQVQLMNHFFNGNKEKMLGNYELAVNYFNKCLKIDGQHGAALYELAGIYSLQGKDVMALDHIERAVSTDDDNVWYHRLRADIFEKHGRFKDAANAYALIIKKDPNDLDAYYAQANALVYGKDLKGAIGVYDKLEEITGINEEVSLQKERLYIRLGEVDKAIAELTTLIDAMPNEPRYYGMLAELYQKQGKPDLALATYKKLLELDPNNPYVHLSLSEYYSDAGEHARAFEELKMAFSTTNLDIDTKVQILLDYYEKMDVDSVQKKQAFELSEILVETHPAEAKAYSIRGDFLNRDGQSKDARDAFHKAAELAPDKFVIWNQLLLLESELRNFDNMAEESQEAMELFPSQPVFYLHNGVAHIQNKQYDTAVESLNSGRNLIIGNPGLKAQFFMYLGDAYHGLDNNHYSDSCYERTLELDPQNVYVLNNYAYYLSLRADKLERAAELSKKAIDMFPNQPSYLDTYGWILYKQGKFDDARQYLFKAVEKGGGNSDVVVEHYGDALWQVGKKDEAVEQWNKAGELGEGSEHLQKKIETQQLVE